MNDRRYQRVLLCQPNYSWCGKRTWRLLPYGLGLLNACLKRAGYDSDILDANVPGLTEEQFRDALRRLRPDVVGVGTTSSEYIEEPRRLTAMVKEVLPQALVVEGGCLPTVMIEVAMQDPNVDYHVLGEGEQRLVALLDALNHDPAAVAAIDGLAYAGRVQPAETFIEDLDSVPFPDYGTLDLEAYTLHRHRQAHTILPRQFPYQTTITSRGCPYRCTFCAGRTVSGKRVRMRSAGDVLAEIDAMHEAGVREVIFLDDHFLADRERAVAIMRGLIERDYGLTWKCVNVCIWHLDDELLRLMRDSGSYQLTVSIESGNQEVLRKLVRKPVKLDRVPAILARARAYGFEIASNFVFGFPGETWEQIRETVDYASTVGVDLVNFHIATPMPQTELMEICLRDGHLRRDTAAGYTEGRIETSEFSAQDLKILRTYEWDRINFGTPERRATIARMEGLTDDELEAWRRRTRRQLGAVLAGQE